jgi:hypothetical protein
MTETEPLWLQLARSDLGVSEVVGPKASLVIKGYFNGVVRGCLVLVAEAVRVPDTAAGDQPHGDEL